MKECKKLIDKLGCLVLEKSEEDVFEQSLSESNYVDAVEQVFSFGNEISAPLSFKTDEKQYISLKNRMKSIFRSHGAVFVKTALLKPHVQEYVEPIGSPSLTQSYDGSSSSLISSTQSSSPVLTSSQGNFSGCSSSSLTRSSSQLSMLGSTLSSPSTGMGYSSSGSPTKACPKTERRKGKAQKGKKSERRHEPQFMDVVAISPDGNLIDISNGGPEFMQKLDSNDQALRTYSFAAGLFVTEGKLVPMRTANFCIQETLRTGNESSVLATLEAEFFVVLCTCLYEQHDDLTVLLSYSKDPRPQKEKFNKFVGKEEEYMEFVKDFESELLRSELKELYSALNTINFFSDLSTKKFCFDPKKLDSPPAGLFVQVTNSHESVIAEGRCEILSGNTVNLNFRIFMDKLIPAAPGDLSGEGPEGGACAVDGTPPLPDEIVPFPSRGEPIVVTSDPLEEKDGLECCSCRKELSKVCIVVKAGDRKYKGLSIAHALWKMGFEVSFQCDNVKIHDPFTKDPALGWSIVVGEDDGIISMMKKSKHKAEAVKIDVGDNVEKCLDIIVRTSCEGESDVIQSFLVKQNIEVIEVQKFFKKAKKNPKSKPNSKTTSKSISNSSSKSISKSASSSVLGKSGSGSGGRKKVLNERIKRAISEYYEKSLGEFAKQYPSVKIVVMEGLTFSDIVEPLFTDGIEEIYIPYKKLFSTLWELKKSGSLVVLVNYNSKREAEERYDNSLVLTPENLAYIKKKYRIKELPKSSLMYFSSSSSLSSSASTSESSLSGKSSSSSSSLLGSQGFSKSTPSFNEGLNPQKGEDDEGQQVQKKSGVRNEKKGKKK